MKALHGIKSVVQCCTVIERHSEKSCSKIEDISNNQKHAQSCQEQEAGSHEGLLYHFVQFLPSNGLNADQQDVPSIKRLQNLRASEMLFLL